LLDGDPALLPKKGRSSPIFGPRLLWPNGCMDQDATWYAGRPRFTRRCVRWGPSCPSPKGAQPAIFGQCRCGQTAGWTKMPLGMEVQATLCSMGIHLPPEKWAHPPHPVFRPCLFYCGQTAGCINMPLGTEVNLGPGDVVLDGVAAPPTRGTAPVFGSCLLWPNGWMAEDTTWCGSRPHCTRRGPSSPRKGAQQPGLFSAHVYCGHGRPSQLLLSCCTSMPKVHLSELCMQQVFTGRMPFKTPIHRTAQFARH